MQLMPARPDRALTLQPMMCRRPPSSRRVVMTCRHGAHGGQDLDAGVYSTQKWNVCFDAASGTQERTALVQTEWPRWAAVPISPAVMPLRQQEGMVNRKPIDMRGQSARSADGSTIVILMFKVWGSEAGSSVGLVNQRYCCSRLTNGSNFACRKGLFYEQQHSQVLVQPWFKAADQQSSSS